jgi:hypothetical protein
MEYLTIDWLESKGFKSKGNSTYQLTKGDTTFGADLLKGLVWIDGEDIYVMKRADTIDELVKAFAICGYDTKFKYSSPEKKGDFNLTVGWLAFNGFVRTDEHKWERRGDEFIVRYNFNTNILSVVSNDMVEGYEGKVLSEDLARTIINEVFA